MTDEWKPKVREKEMHSTTERKIKGYRIHNEHSRLNSVHLGLQFWCK